MRSDWLLRKPWVRRAGGVAVLLAVGLAGGRAALDVGMRPALRARRAVRHGAAGSYRYSVLGNPGDVTRPTRPGLVLEGGGPDIDESFRWLIERSGGGDFVVLRTTGTDAYNEYVYELGTPGGTYPDSVATLIVADRAASFDPFVLATIRRAEALWIAGGDQGRHVALWRRTPVVAAIQELAARGVPIGGTSSGLAVMGQFVYTAETDRPDEPHLSSPEVLRDPFHPRVTLARDFLHLPHLDGVLLEPHFLQEDRYGRMAAFLARLLARHPGREVRGIGVERQTALLVEPDGRARVIASPGKRDALVALFRMPTPPEVCEPGRALTARAIELLEFGPGSTLDLRSWDGAGGVALDLSIEAGTPRLERAPTAPPDEVRGPL
jgi:cyanophycinase